VVAGTDQNFKRPWSNSGKGTFVRWIWASGGDDLGVKHRNTFLPLPHVSSRDICEYGLIVQK
jgi:hypothetical protein